jgi:hypothetical protein
MLCQCYAGLIVPELLADGQVKVDMGPPILDGPRVPTSLSPTRGSTVVQQVSAFLHRTDQSCGLAVLRTLGR